MKKFTLLCIAFLLAGEALAQFTYTYTGKPRFQILTRRGFTDTLGIINVELFPNIAPLHTRNFDSLVSTGFYDSTAFHRVVPGFVIQGGDPNTRSGPQNTWGFGNPNQPMVNAEFSAAKHLRGILSAARQAGNINSATSQFFICVANTPNLNGQYSIYGRVTGGMNWVDTIVNTPRNMSNDRPLQKIDMFIDYIGSNDTVPVAPFITSPQNGSSVPDVTIPTYLMWNAVSDGIIYQVEVAFDSLFTNMISTVNTSELFYTLTGLQDYNTYYWRVRTNNGGHFSPWSAVQLFHTTWILTGVSTVPGNKAISVFPNPGIGKFTFSGLQPGDRLKVVDVTGKLLYDSIINETSALVDLEGKEKGVYFYQLSNGRREVQKGKLIVK